MDANLPEAGWGSPQWLDPNSHFRRAYADVEIVLERTDHAVQRFRREGLRIAYLHIDADHTYEGCLADFRGFSDLVVDNGIITFHDTDMEGVDRVVSEVRRVPGWELTNIPEIGRGLAIARRIADRGAAKRYEPWQTPPSRSASSNEMSAARDRLAEPPGGMFRADRAIGNARRAAWNLGKRVARRLQVPRGRAILGRIEALLLAGAGEPRLPPIFLLGPARSGTTLAYQCATLRYRVSYFSNLMTLFAEAPALVARVSASVGAAHPSPIFESRYGEAPGLRSPHQG